MSPFKYRSASKEKSYISNLSLTCTHTHTLTHTHTHTHTHTLTHTLLMEEASNGTVVDPQLATAHMSYFVHSNSNISHTLLIFPLQNTVVQPGDKSQQCHTCTHHTHSHIISLSLSFMYTAKS